MAKWIVTEKTKAGLRHAVIVDLCHGQDIFGRLNHKEHRLSKSPEGRRIKETKQRSETEGSKP